MKEPNEKIIRVLEDLFRDFTAEATKFSKDVTSMTADYFENDPEKSAKMNLAVTKLIFGKWSIEILTVLYALRQVGFEDLRIAVGDISPRILSVKLKALERFGIVTRSVISSRPPRVQYRLTEKGLTIAKLGEPVFLFLGFTENLFPTSDGRGELLWSLRR